jgi:putative membrane protein
MYWQDLDWWAWVPMTIGMILFWGVVAWVAVRLLVEGRGPVREPQEPAAREILDARLARGAIDGAEYEEARRLLEVDASTSGRGEHEGATSGPAAASGAEAR